MRTPSPLFQVSTEADCSKSQKTQISRKFLAALSLIPLLGGALALDQPVYAVTTDTITNTVQTESDTYSELRAFLTTHNVNEKTQDLLLQKLESGVLWDSVNGGSPVSIHRNSNNEEIRTYPDGSIAVFSITPDDSISHHFSNPALISPAAVSGCARSGVHYATYWKNCLASWDYGFIQYYLTFDYQNVRGDGSKITDFRYARADSQFGSVSNVTTKRDAANQVTLSGFWQAPGGWSSRTHVNVLRSDGPLAITSP